MKLSVFIKRWCNGTASYSAVGVDDNAYVGNSIGCVVWDEGCSRGCC
jgi:hypothetical protein